MCEWKKISTKPKLLLFSFTLCRLCWCSFWSCYLVNIVEEKLHLPYVQKWGWEVHVTWICLCLEDVHILDVHMCYGLEYLIASSWESLRFSRTCFNSRIVQYWYLEVVYRLHQADVVDSNGVSAYNRRWIVCALMRSTFKRNLLFVLCKWKWFIRARKSDSEWINK